MAIGNITPFETSNSKFGGSLKYYVAANSTGADGAKTRIQPGEPVTQVAGAAGVLAAATNAPTTTLRIVGVAASVSTETASLAGTVDVIPSSNGLLWKCAVKVAGDIDTQAKYNALCGARVLIDNTAGVYSMLSADGSSNGCVIEYNDIAKLPGFIVFSFSPLVDYRNV